MERARLWLQTLALTLLALTAAVYVGRDVIRPARAAETPVCQFFDSGKLAWEKAAEDITQQTAAFLAANAGREHVVVVPYSRTASGNGTGTAVICAW